MAAPTDISSYGGVSRRGLLRGAGSIAAAGLSGCSPQRSQASIATRASRQPPVAPSTPDQRLLAASGLPAWRTAMAARTWARIGNDMGSVDPARNPALNPNYPNEAPWRGVGGFGMITAAWSGGAYDRTSDTLRVFGGGHADYAGNEVPEIELAVEEPKWRLAIGPTVDIGDDSLEPTSVYPDGRPRSSHTYNTVVAVGADLYVHQGSTWRSGVGATRLFRLRAGAWENLGPAFGMGGMCYDEKRHSLVFMGYAFGAPIMRYDIATKAITKGGDTLMGGGAARMVRIPELDVVVALWGKGFGVYGYERTPGALARPPGVASGAPISRIVSRIDNTSWAGTGGAFWEQGGGDWTDGASVPNGPKPVRSAIAAAGTTIDITGIDGDLILKGSSNFDSAWIDGKPVEAFWLHSSSNQAIPLPTQYLTGESTAIISNPAKGKTLVLRCSQIGAPITIYKLRTPIASQPPASNPHRTGEWVPELNAIVQWDGGTGFETLTPPTGDPLTRPWTWGRIEAVSGAPSAPQQNGTFGRFFYSPRLRAFGVSNGGPVDIFALGDTQ